jgi:hypothetical protein
MRIRRREVEMSLLINPIADEVMTLEHRRRVAEGERRYQALAALATPSPRTSRRSRLQTRLGDSLIAAGERLRGTPRLEPLAG